MLHRLPSAALLLCLPALLVGCSGSTPDTSEPKQPLIWIEQEVAHDGLKISLGYRAPLTGAESGLEPVAAITRDGKAVANAMVFNGLASADGKELIGEEVATVYEPATGSDPALYAQGKLKRPEGTSPQVVRFRIILPETEQEWTRSVEVPLR